MKSMQGTVKMLNKEHMTKKDKVLLRGLNKDYQLKFDNKED